MTDPVSLPRLAPAPAPASAPAQAGPFREVVALRPARLDEVLAALDPPAAAFVRDAGFRAAEGTLALVPGPDGVARALFGLGEGHDPHLFGALAARLPAGSGAWRLDPAALAASGFGADDALFGWCAGAYRFRPAEADAATLVPPEGAALGADMAHALLAGRDLVNAPANLLGPWELAAAAERVADRHGARFRRVSGAELEGAYPTIAAVGRGADRVPAVAHFTWRGSTAAADAPLVSLVGKGVCFDSGGLDIKTAAGMLLMRKDMGGAAVVLALAELAMRRDLPLRLAVRIGCVENAISGAAMRPGDVVRTRAGLTVEINNTDAEGRLVLADLLHEAAGETPHLLLDVATLTGAARTALGPDLPALFTDDDALAARIAAAGAAMADPVWRLPLWPGYAPWLETGAADLANVAKQTTAGAIVAALFLRRFVPASTPWAHFDAYCWNDRARPGRPEGGEIPLLRALFRVLTNLCESGI